MAKLTMHRAAAACPHTAAARARA
eukprot:COSAG05_NODE_6863_length_891_cov_1.223485_1_plen_23_part_10